MMRQSVPARIALVALAALLALPAIAIDAPIAAKGKKRTVTRTFRDPLTIELIATSTNSPLSSNSAYPAPLPVDGLKGKIRDVNLRLNDFSHSRPDDIEMLLVGPEGQTAVVMADAGGTVEVEDVTLRLDDEAAAPLPATGLQSGTFRPTNVQGAPIAFNNPAPAAGANAALSVFNGTDANGTWNLFVQDDQGPTGTGYFLNGWALEITAKAKARKKR